MQTPGTPFQRRRRHRGHDARRHQFFDPAVNDCPYPAYQLLRDETLLSVLVNREIPEWGRPLNDNELMAEIMAEERAEDVELVRP